MDKRKQLLSYLRTKELLQNRISKIKEHYIDEYTDKNLIYISDHAIVRFLERIKGLTLKGETDSDKVYAYLRANKINGKTLREEILTPKQMEHVVRNEIYIYKANNVTYVIKNLALITVYKEEKK